MKKRVCLWIAMIMIMSCLLPCLVMAEEAVSWTCPECGRENNDQFCPGCGTKKPEAVLCSNCGNEFPLSEGYTFCPKCGAKLNEVKNRTRFEGNGFATPEEAVNCYLEGLKNRDIYAVISAFAIETRAEKQTLEGTLNNYRSYNSATIPSFPNDGSFLQDLNSLVLLDNIVSKIKSGILKYVFSSDKYEISSYGNVTLKEDGEVEQFLASFDLTKVEALSSLTNIRFISPKDLSEKYEANNERGYEKNKVKYGVDDYVELVAEFEIAGKKYMIAPLVGCYNGKWYIVDLLGLAAYELNIDFEGCALWPK